MSCLLCSPCINDKLIDSYLFSVLNYLIFEYKVDGFIVWFTLEISKGYMLLVYSQINKIFDKRQLGIFWSVEQVSSK